MTIRDIIVKYIDKCVDVEFYEWIGTSRKIHTDTIQSIDSDKYNENTEADFWLMNEEEYNNTICANTFIEADFKEWYDDVDTQVLVIVVG